ncbi:MAG: DapH/DapD/GlmU-related protein [Bacteroidales bacterium]|jgi:UDP-3-O-[3-hydroxymyristoyl] glucosamine N-acyltransferase|nr:DapH/DapD/GlmU-related protein [Bacteroidales bacterium]
MNSITIDAILKYLGEDVIISYGFTEGIIIKYLKEPKDVDGYTLDWISSRRNDKQHIAETSKAKVIIVDETIIYSDLLKQANKVLLVVKNPKLAIAKIGNHFFIETPQPGIHNSSIINPNANISKSAYVGSNVTIGKCTIGNNVTIHPGVILYDNVTVGNNVIIHAGAVIGTDGLGCERESDGTLVKFPHLGGVIIEDDVEIGASCQIAKGAISNTIIGKGAKINVGCYIAHNVKIGKNVWISAHAKIAGSTLIKDNSTIFIGASIREHSVIGEGAIIGMAAVVTKNVPAGETWIGNPARKLEKR